MSIIVPNMNLPKGCGDCPFSCGIEFGEMECLADHGLYITDGTEYTRDSKCPLKEYNDPEAPEWLYHTPFEDRSWVDFDAVEKALGFRLFGYQKSYILGQGFRQMGRTTAEILRLLFDKEQYDNPIDFSNPPRNNPKSIFRHHFRDIWEKLNDAGIEMRPVFWSKEDKKKYEIEYVNKIKLDSYRQASIRFNDVWEGEQNDRL